MAKVRDVRFDRLVEIYAPLQETPAHIEFLLLPDLDQQASHNEQVLRGLEQVDVVCLLVRTFGDDTVFHIHGMVDPCRDILFFNEELQLNDRDKGERLRPAPAEQGPARPSVRRRRLEAPPLQLFDALDIMTAKSQDLLVFTEVPSGRLVILQRRPDGGYLLLEPEQG